MTSKLSQQEVISTMKHSVFSSIPLLNQYQAVLALVLVSLLPLAANAETGTNIIATEESPTVLNVVPWQTKELQVNPWDATEKPKSAVLDNALNPVDKDELKREVDYFNQLHNSVVQANPD
jgi:hypothetical protein